MTNDIYFTRNIRGINVHIEQHLDNRNRPTLLLVHGFLSSTFSFRRLIPIVKKQFNILALDLPPFGKTEKSTRFVYSYDNMAKVIIDLLHIHEVKNAIGVGHSMGGQILLYASRKQPDLFEKIILLCSSGYLKRSHPTLIYGSYLPYFSFYVRQVLAKQGIWNSLRNVVYDHSLINQEMLQGYLEPFNDGKIFRALTKMIRDREGDLSSEELNKIETPCLLVWGEEDRVVPVEIGKKLSRDLPNSNFISLKKTGHLVPEEKPEHVSQHIFDFCLG